MDEKVKCSECGSAEDKIDIFPQGRCLACHARFMEDKPIERPDFIGAINGIGKRTN